MTQVMIRRKLAGGNNQLYLAEVLSRKDGMLRVQVVGEKPGAVEVKASEVIDVRKLSGGQPVFDHNNPILDKQYPGRNTLYGRLNGI